VLFAFRELLRVLSSSDAVLQWQAAIFSLLIILIVLFLPRGILALVQARAVSSRALLFGRSPTPSPSPVRGGGEQDTAQ